MGVVKVGGVVGVWAEGGFGAASWQAGVVGGVLGWRGGGSVGFLLKQKKFLDTRTCCQEAGVQNDPQEMPEQTLESFHLPLRALQLEFRFL